jgi:sorbitol-specific phosphotransferase system component IIBC
VAAFEVFLAAIVVLGMATGTGRQTDKGVAPLAAVILWGLWALFRVGECAS